jgi:gluconate 5-dehydrogenase/7-alpha-hydroxysteroid dehydrogenase
VSGTEPGTRPSHGSVALSERWSLTDRTAIVTGVGPGIGSAVARGFSDAGANVVLAARSAERVEILARELERDGGRALAVPTDVSDQTALEHLVEQATRRFGPVHIVFNNAAAHRVEVGASELDLAEGDWIACLQVNILAPYRLAQLTVPGMKAAGYGSIINVLSTAAYTPITGIRASAYAATKSGLATLTRYLTAACGPEVRVNAICPGTIDADGSTRPHWAELVQRSPLGRVGSPDEIVGAALYLASNASSYVSGQVIVVDGGRTAVAH